MTRNKKETERTLCQLENYLDQFSKRELYQCRWEEGQEDGKREICKEKERQNDQSNQVITNRLKGWNLTPCCYMQ